MHFPSCGIVVDDIKRTQRDVVAAGGFIGGGGPRVLRAGNRFPLEL